jgi:hypothetical protein
MLAHKLNFIIFWDYKLTLSNYNVNIGFVGVEICTVEKHPYDFCPELLIVLFLFPRIYILTLYKNICSLLLYYYR